MGKKSKILSEPIGLEIISSSDVATVFKQTISYRGKNEKEIKIIKSNLNTATLHNFSEKDFVRLKEIERDLIIKLSDVRTQKRSFMQMLYKFFEI